MSHTGEIYRCCDNGGPVPPLASIAGVAAGSGWQAIAAVKGWRCSSNAVREGQSQQRPHTSRGTTAATNTMAFFVRIDVFVCWHEGGCGNNSSGNVFALMATRAGGRWPNKCRRGEKENMVSVGTLFDGYIRKLT
jgi:hypothetical protein